MLASLTAFLLCQLAGEAIVRAVGIPVPGPVVGMALLFVLMLVRAPLPTELNDT
jgi:holin-like protein